MNENDSEVLTAAFLLLERRSYNTKPATKAGNRAKAGRKAWEGLREYLEIGGFEPNTKE